MSGWATLVDAAAPEIAALQNALADPLHAQASLLAEILRENAGSEFGRAHGFSGIRDVRDFRKAVPVRRYEDFSAQIDRMAAGEPNVLTCAPVVAFEETGGSSSGRKLVPYTPRALASFRRAVLPWLAELVTRRPAITAGSAYVSITPATRQRLVTSGGIPIGLPSEAAYLGEDLAGGLVSLLAVPPDVGLVPDIGEWRVQTLAHLVERDDLAFVSVWSPTFFLELMGALRDNMDAVASRLSGEARSRLARALRGDVPATSVLWPSLDTISCWADGGSSAFARRVQALFPQATLDPKGLLATEAAVTLSWGGGRGAIPALTSTFVEFRDSADNFLLAHELTPGAAYRVVLTTFGGLYRYDIGDSVRCVTMEGKAPRLMFEGRTSFVSDMVGEKLDEAFVASCLSDMDMPAALVAVDRPHLRYEVWIDAGAFPPARLESLRENVETALLANPQYAYARKVGQLQELIARLSPGFSQRLSQMRAESGRRLGDIKHVSLIKAEEGMRLMQHPDNRP